MTAPVMERVWPSVGVPAIAGAEMRLTEVMTVALVRAPMPIALRAATSISVEAPGCSGAPIV